MRTLLCLLSDQHVPNLLSVHHFRPDRLVLVESEAMRERGVADDFLRALKLGGLDYGGDRCERQPLAHEDALPEIRRALQDAYGRHPSDEWIVNVTGGTKPMSIGTFQFFSVLEATRVYINQSRPNEIQFMDGAGIERVAHRPTIAEFLAGYGFQSQKSPDDVAAAEDRARQWWDLARALAAEFGSEELLQFESDKERKKAKEKRLDLMTRHLHSRLAASPTARSFLARTFALNETDDGLTGQLDKYQVQFLLGSWLEVFLWGLLERCREALNIWDVRLGIVPQRPGQEANEFDVSFMRNYGLWMVECKTGSQEYDKGGEILYKIEAIIRQPRALHVRTILATTSSNVLDEQGQVRPEIKNRAAAHRCTIVRRDQIRDLAASDNPSELLKTILGW